MVEDEWGSEDIVRPLAPSRADDPTFLKRVATYWRRSASPGAAADLLRMNTEIDVRAVLPAIRVPTLILHRTHDTDSLIDEGRWIAGQIPGAQFVELDGGDHLFWIGDTEAVLAEIEGFLTGIRPAREADRVLATVMFTDLVGSTEQAAQLGDRRWHEVLENHRAEVRSALARWQGMEIATTGDGFLATFDGPVRAIRCAVQVRDAAAASGHPVRAGLHTGEVEQRADQVSGLAVHIAARVMASAGENEVWVSGTVRDLVAGAGLPFADRGSHSLKGVPGEWHLYSVGEAAAGS